MNKKFKLKGKALFYKHNVEIIKQAQADGKPFRIKINLGAVSHGIAYRREILEE